MAQQSAHRQSQALMTSCFFAFLSKFSLTASFSQPPHSLPLCVSHSTSLCHSPAVHFSNKLLSIAISASEPCGVSCVCVWKSFKMRKESRWIRWIKWIVIVTVLFVLGFCIGERVKPTLALSVYRLILPACFSVSF